MIELAKRIELLQTYKEKFIKLLHIKKKFVLLIYNNYEKKWKN